MQPVKLLDYFFVLRPMLFFQGWTLTLAGYYVARAVTGDDWNIPSADWFPLFQIFLSTALFMGWVFIRNQIEDIETDKKNQKLFLISGNHIPLRHAIIEARWLLVLALACAWWMGWIFFLLFTIAWISGIFYNERPFRWKNRPILGIIVNVLGGQLFFIVGWLIRKPLEPALFLITLPYILLSVAFYIYTTLFDVRGDEATGKITFSVRFGMRKAAVTGLLFLIAGLNVGFYVRDYFISIIILLSLPLCIYLTFKTTCENANKAVKVSLAVFSLGVCVSFPPYLLLMIVFFCFTKAYYKLRFNFNYPNFKAES